jgi:hypothetical protein
MPVVSKSMMAMALTVWSGLEGERHYHGPAQQAMDPGSESGMTADLVTPGLTNFVTPGEDPGSISPASLGSADIGSNHNQCIRFKHTA